MSGPSNRVQVGKIARSVWSADLHLRAFRVGWRDQAKIGVEDSDQVIEVPGAVGIARCFEQLLPGSHLPLDVGAGLGQESFENRLGCFLVKRCSGGAVEALKVSSRNVSPTPWVPPTSLQRGRSPRLSLHHLGEERQSHGDDFAFLGKTCDGLIQERLLVPGEVARPLWQLPVGGARTPSAPFWAWRGSKRSTAAAVLSFEEVGFPGRS